MNGKGSLAPLEEKIEIFGWLNLKICQKKTIEGKRQEFI